MTLEAVALATIASFAACLIAIPYFVRFFNRIGIVGTDQQKPQHPIVPQAGGIPVFFAFLLGAMLFVGINTFLNGTQLNLLFIFAALLSTSVIAMVGFFDDLNIRSQKVAISSDAIDYRVGLKQWQKPLLTLVAAVPLVAVNAGESSALLPLIGVVDFGILFPLVIIPIAVICVSNATNMLAGVNGLEAGTTSVALTAIGLFLLQAGRTEGAIIALCAAGALLAFLKFNWFPAKMLPGDSLTYFAGAAIVSAIIIGNAEKLGILLFIPWIVEAFLKLRGRFKVRSYGDLQRDGTLKAPYQKIYSLTHFAMKLPPYLGMKKGFTEKQVAYLLIGTEVVIAISVLLFYNFLAAY
ncbi:hypothetical protein HY571_00245 [Candidatus Micrarchaeota archaeon]|nr:hypothetical protein [Candidatus Micrarchaeota archaeon]